MSLRTHALERLMAVGLAFSLSACGDPVVTPLPEPFQPPAPPAPPPGPPLSLIGMSPKLGSTGGGTPLVITGTGFESGLVTLGGTVVQGRFDHRDAVGTIIYLEAPAHSAGTVDLVVTNRAGQVVTLPGAYTYAPPQSFDFNGEWSGWDIDGIHVWIKFSIKNNELVSVSCDEKTLTFSTPPAVTNGEFSYSRDDGFAVSGRIVSASVAVGTINLAPCNSVRWIVERG